MRAPIKLQMTLGEIGIGKINFDLKSRDEIPQLLAGLQHIYCTKNIREQVFQFLEDIIPTNIDKGTGRPGMFYWEILVLGTLRLNKDYDYDALHEIANNHKNVRQMLGHVIQYDDGEYRDDGYEYKLQTIKDNVVLLTPEALKKISQIVIQEGHKVVLKGVPYVDSNGDRKIKEYELCLPNVDNSEKTLTTPNLSEEKIKLKGRCDSFVLETNICYPTDIRLLFDAVRKTIELTVKLCIKLNLPCSIYKDLVIKELKKAYRLIQKLRRSTSKDENKKEQREQAIVKAYMDYIDLANDLIEKAEAIIKPLKDANLASLSKINEIYGFISDADKQVCLTDRRVIGKETIPHEMKIFSLFERHTEWISKGKIGVPVEFGLKVCILEDQYGFILNHKVVQNQTDEKYAVEFIREAKKMFANLESCSFDKGFYTPNNREELAKELNLVILPKKGRLSQKDKETESQEEFRIGRRQHSAVESAINALEVHGLNVCPDRGIQGFKRYASLAVLARNIQILGSIILAQQKEAIRLQKAA